MLRLTLVQRMIPLSVENVYYAAQASLSCGGCSRRATKTRFRSRAGTSSDEVLPPDNIGFLAFIIPGSSMFS